MSHTSAAVQEPPLQKIVTTPWSWAEQLGARGRGDIGTRALLGQRVSCEPARGVPEPPRHPALGSQCYWHPLIK